MTVRSVDWPHYHIWTDAIHGRQLARDARNEWNRGAYVRWSISSAWTAFETTCEDLLTVTGLGNRFKEHLDRALADKGFAQPDWSQGLWQDVLGVYSQRKSYVHIPHGQVDLFPPTSEADAAIAILRAAIKDMYRRVGANPPEWPDDDEDPLDPRGTMAHATVIHPGGDAPDAVRITYVMLDKEHTAEILPAGSDPSAVMDDLLRRIRVPVTAVRAYRGDVLIDELQVRMRGTSLDRHSDGY